MRLRSANRGNANNTWYMNTAGNINNNNAYNALRGLPDLVEHRTHGLCTARVLRAYFLKEPNALQQC